MARSMKSRRSLTNDERIRIALDRFATLKTEGKLRSLSELSKIYGRDGSVISKAVAQAFQKGLVEIQQIERPVEELQRVEHLERLLLDTFPGLHAALVVDVEERIDTQVGNSLRESDRIHRSLGVAMAKELARGTMLRDEDVVGVGSGRGVFYTVEALSHSASLRVKGARIMSLTGSASPKAHHERLNVLLDADFHAALLARCFSQPVVLKTTSFPIAHENESKVRQNTWLDKGEFEKRKPTHALMGVGVLEGAHRFYRLVKEPNPEDDTMKAIEGPLARLVDWVDREGREDPPYCPVADICHHLFLVEPPPGVKLEKREEIKSEMRKINGKLLTLRDPQLQDIENIILIAGTRRKALAIRQLLLREDLSVRMVCTDASSAEEMLKQR